MLYNDVDFQAITFRPDDMVELTLLEPRNQQATAARLDTYVVHVDTISKELLEALLDCIFDVSEEMSRTVRGAQ